MAGDEVFRIVVGVDGSAPSRLALEWAVTEARLRHGQLNAVTAWEFPPGHGRHGTTDPGRGGFTGLLLGSVSAQVLHHSPCPVLVVRTRPGAQV